MLRFRFLLLSLAGLAGCNKPNDATEAAFRRAIEPLVENRFCRAIRVDERRADPYARERSDGAWPVTIAAAPAQWAGRAEIEARAMLEAAAAQGLLARATSTARTRPKDNMSDLDAAPTALLSYMPTEKGKTMFRTVEQRTAGNGRRGFAHMCLGRGKVDEIVRWTEPADSFGRTMAQVTYRYSAQDLPADMPAIARREAETPRETSVTLIRANDGWVTSGR